MKSPAQRALTAVALASAMALAFTGCAVPADSEPAPGAPSELVVPWVFDATGVSSSLNGPTREAFELRFDLANESGELGDLTVRVDVLDSQSDAKVGVGLMTEVAASDAPIAVFGTTSSVAAAVAPIAHDAGLPLVLAYSGSPGVVETGENIFRVTAPQFTYHQIAVDYFADQGVKTAAIIYNNDNATLKSLAEEFYPAALGEKGIEIVRSPGVSFQATDLSAEMTGIIGDDPDLVIMLVLSQQNSSVITQLRRADYGGIISAQPGIGHQALLGLGADADGVVYPIDFSPSTTEPSGVEFVQAFEAAFGTPPDTFAASGWDAATMVIEAIKRADELTRDSLRAAVTAIANEGMRGAVGQIDFIDRDARVAGMLVRWEDGREVLAR